MDFQGRTPLTAATRAGSLQAVKLLLEHGADASMRDGHDRTVFDYLEERRGDEFDEIRSLLERAGSDP
jgi:ankyrin repeat protein